jgi:hypothetical protein
VSDVLDPDDEAFRALMDDVDLEMPTDVELADYSGLSNFELMERFGRVRSDLAETGEMLFPKSPEAVDLSAIYHGLLAERRKRGM